MKRRSQLVALSSILLAAYPITAEESEFRRLLDENKIDRAIDLIHTESYFGPLHDGDRLPLCQAVGSWGSLGYELTKALLDRGADPNPICNNGNSALHRAARWGKMEIVTMLVDRGADVNLDPSGDWDTPLIAAFLHGHERTAAFLRDRGANAPESVITIAKKHAAAQEEEERLIREIPRSTTGADRERLQDEITIKALLAAQRLESNPYRKMYETMYLERALQKQQQYDPETDGDMGEFFVKSMVAAMFETQVLLEKQGNWYPERLKEDLPPELRNRR